jgi:hypothetical protein
MKRRKGLAFVCFLLAVDSVVGMVWATEHGRDLAFLLLMNSALIWTGLTLWLTAERVPNAQK